MMDEINSDIYRQMIELQEKLKQSEAERTRLEEMFKVLLKTIKDEEDMRLKNLEIRYHSFLENCARRNNRNEKILRSVERVENAANVLYAKTERLKLLRNHYEAYLGRVIPSWRQVSSIHYGPNQLLPGQKMEWYRQSQLVSEEIPGENHENYLRIPTGLTGRTTYYSDENYPAYYLLKRPVERERQRHRLSGNRTYFSRDNLNETCTDPETWEKQIYRHTKDRHPTENCDAQLFDFGRNKPTKPLFNIEEINYDETVTGKGIDSALHRKFVSDDTWNSTKNYVCREGVDDSITHDDYLEKSNLSLNEPFLRKFSQMLMPEEERQDIGSRTRERFPNIIEGQYANNRPVISREPVEIKKPEFIVGKLDPETTMKFEHFNRPPDLETPSEQSAKQENFFTLRPAPVSNDELQESGSVRIKIAEAAPQNKWSLLKHKNCINKLKETLYFEEGQDQKEVEDKREQNITRIVENSYRNSPEKELKKQEDSNRSEILPEDWHDDVEQTIPSGFTSENSVVSNPNILPNGGEEIHANEAVESRYENQYQEGISEYAQKEEICVSNEEGYEDNEESYPESYFEQPPKPEYSRNIVSNVILEEDESEVYANESVQDDVQVGEKIEKDQTQYDSIATAVSKSNIEFDTIRTEDIEENETLHQNLHPDNAVYSEMDAYANGANYSDVQEQQYIYENQEYNQSNDYNNAEQYHDVNVEQQEYYDQSQELENYAQGAMEQSYENVYNQTQDFENNHAIQQYGENCQEGYNQGEVMSNENYYNQGEYEGSYYDSQLQQNNGYPQNEQQENEGMLQSDGFESNQPEDGRYGDESKNLPLRQSNLAHFLESDSESFQMEHGSTAANEDSDFDFSLSQRQ